MNFPSFLLERWLGKQSADLDLGGACVKSLKFNDLEKNFDTSLMVSYGQTKGDEHLRKLVSGLYPGTGPENVLITIGTAEANFLALSHALDPGDEFFAIKPTYMGSLGIASGFGAEIKSVSLNDEDFSLNLDLINESITEKTKVLFFTNPNNPTGTKFSESEIRQVCEIAKEKGIFIIFDEALRGLELDGKQTTPATSLYDKAICTGSLSKLGLPGLRLGWLVSSDACITNNCWSYKDYTSLGIPILTEYFGRLALEKNMYSSIVSRARRLLNNNIEIFMDWAEENRKYIRCIKPQAGATVFPKYSVNIDSFTFCSKLLKEKNILISPGDVFDVPKHFRLKYAGHDQETLRQALDKMTDFLKKL